MSDEMISLGAKLAQLAQLKPDAPAVTCGETTLTYEQFHRLSNRAARGLMDRRGGDLAVERRLIARINGCGFWRGAAFRGTGC